MDLLILNFWCVKGRFQTYFLNFFGKRDHHFKLNFAQIILNALNLQHACLCVVYALRDVMCPCVLIQNPESTWASFTTFYFVFLKQDLSVSLELTIMGRLTGPWTSGISCLCYSFPSPGDLNSSPYTCAVSTLTSEPSAWPPIWS